MTEVLVLLGVPVVVCEIVELRETVAEPVGDRVAVIVREVEEEGDALLERVGVRLVLAETLGLRVAVGERDDVIEDEGERDGLAVFVLVALSRALFEVDADAVTLRDGCAVFEAEGLRVDVADAVGVLVVEIEILDERVDVAVLLVEGEPDGLRVEDWVFVSRAEALDVLDCVLERVPDAE